MKHKQKQFLTNAVLSPLAILELRTIAVTIYAMIGASKVRNHSEIADFSAVLTDFAIFRRCHAGEWDRLIDEKCEFCRANMGESQAGVKIPLCFESEDIRQLQCLGSFRDC